MKKGDDDNNDAMRRTSVSQDRVTETLYSEELFHITQYKSLSTSQIGKNVWGGGVQTVKTTHLAATAGFHTSQLVLHVIYRVSDRHGFSYNYFVTVEDK
jgi:hypothetical protein